MLARSKAINLGENMFVRVKNGIVVKRLRLTIFIFDGRYPILRFEINPNINKYYIQESMSNTGIGSIFMQKGEKHVYFH
ncbi:hypothetical protein EP57_03920 [Listeria booriae]|uniref:Uncharacterized protein n=1 Tax=Listeria booriae TaxID=1552123 RepID=A0A099WC79_9LIST|nr:hypothetical protein EP57_03920 [Listeria booriae]